MLSFMRVGHTRLVDACFGLLKQHYRRSECDTMKQLETVVTKSSKCNSVQLFDWEWREWDKFLLKKFKPLNGICKLHHFRFSKDVPGIIFTRTDVESSESKVKHFKRGVKPTDFSVDDLPSLLNPRGISRDRIQYLRKEIKPFVLPEFRNELFLSLST